MLSLDPRETVYPVVSRSPGRDSGPLQAAREDFAIVSRGDHPVMLNGSLFPGVPDRAVGLEELQDWLLDPHCSRATRDAVWAHLVMRTRTDGAVLSAACVGLALPMLTRLARRLSHRFADDPSDLHATVLAGFTAELAVIDLRRPEILVRLRWAAYRAGHAALREALDAPPPAPDRFTPREPREPSSHPDLVLAHAVAEGVLTAREAGLISATRLGEDTLTATAHQLAVAYKTLHQTRHRAEARLAAWLRQAPTTDPPPVATHRDRRGEGKTETTSGRRVENSPQKRSSSL